MTKAKFSYNGDYISGASNSKCMIRWKPEPRIKRTNDGYTYYRNEFTPTYSLSTIRLTKPFNYDSEIYDTFESNNSTETQNESTLTDNTSEQFDNYKIHSTTLNYKFAAGTIKDNACSDDGQKMTFEIGLNGGACYRDGEGVKNPGYTYGGDFGLTGESVVGGREVQALITGGLTGKCQDYHFTKSETTSLPEQLATASADINMGLKITGYPYAWGSIGGFLGYEGSLAKFGDKKVSFHGATTGVKAEVGGFIRLSENSPVTFKYSVAGEYNYSLKGKFFNKDAAPDGNRSAWEIALGITAMW